MFKKFTLPRRFPHASCNVRGFPTLRVLPASPTSTAASASLWMVLSVCILSRATALPRPPWISQVPGASLYLCAVFSDPAGVSGSHRHCRLPTIAFQVFDLVGLRVSNHEAQSLHLHYGPEIALSTLSPFRYLHKPKTRSPVKWLPLFLGRGFHPLEAPGCAWRTEKAFNVGFQYIPPREHRLRCMARAFWRALLWAEPVGEIQKDLLIDGFQEQN